MIPKGLRIKERKYCNNEKYQRLRRNMENGVMRKITRGKKKELKKRLKGKLEDHLNIFIRYPIMEELD